jgi:hypothetical protein
MIVLVNSAVGITTYLVADRRTRRPVFGIAVGFGAVLVAAGIEYSLGYLGAAR